MKENMLTLPGVELSTSGLKITKKLTYDQWEQVGKSLKHIQGCIQWWIGDWLRYGEAEYGEKYSQAMDETDYEYGTLRNSVYVAGSIPPERRVEGLSFSHHAQVAALPPAEQDEKLKQACHDKMTVRQLRETVHPKQAAGTACVCPKCQTIHHVRERK